MEKPVCVFWLNEAKVYEQALASAGLADRFELHAVKDDDDDSGRSRRPYRVLVTESPDPI